MKITRRSLIRGVASIAALASMRAMGQQTQRLARVAFVYAVPIDEMTGSDPKDPRTRAFVQGLRDLGLVDGHNIIVERRSNGGSAERYPALMQEVVGLGVDVIVTFGPGAMAAHRATDRIPIVALAADILDAGLVDGLSRPGGNLTGIGENRLHGKRLQILKEAAPAISRVAVFSARPASSPRAKWRDELDAAGQEMRLDVLWIGVDARMDLEPAFAMTVRERADALYIPSDSVNYTHRNRIADFALKQRLPSMGFADGVVAGMLLSYAADDIELMRRAAFLVKKILDGAKPGDLPFEQATKYSLMINLKTAKALGLTIPPSVLLRADEVIQ